MNNPTAGGSYIRQPDGSLKLVEKTAQLGTDEHEGFAQTAPEAEQSKPGAVAPEKE